MGVERREFACFGKVRTVRIARIATEAGLVVVWVLGVRLSTGFDAFL